MLENLVWTFGFSLTALAHCGRSLFESGICVPCFSPIPSRTVSPLASGRVEILESVNFIERSNRSKTRHEFFSRTSLFVG